MSDEEIFEPFSAVDCRLTAICQRVPLILDGRAWLIEAVVGVWIGNNLKLCTRYGTRAFRFDAFSWRRPVIFLCDKHYGGRLNYVANSP